MVLPIASTMFKSAPPTAAALATKAKADGAEPSETTYVTKVRGHRVLLVQEGSPAQKSGLVPYLDIITHVGEQQLDDGKHTLAKTVVPYIDQDVDVTVYSILTKSVRIVMLNPNKNWGGAGVLGLVAR